MLLRAKALNASLYQRPMQVIQRGFAYKAGHEPAVFVNSDTKVICQGITGKQVSYSFFQCILEQFRKYRWCLTHII
jgi:succinyl-CoA synthetase alpha subunit